MKLQLIKIAASSASVLALAGALTACSSANGRNVEEDTVGAYGESMDSIVVAEGMAAEMPKQSYTRFTAGKHEVVLPSMDDLGLANDSCGVKSVTIYGLTPWGGMGDMEDRMSGFNSASSAAQAKNYGDVVSSYTFDRDGRITKANLAMVDYTFSYDGQGRPVSVTVEEEGYRGAPSYNIRYTIAWSGDEATSVSRKFLTYDPGFNEDTPRDKACPFTTDFSKSPFTADCNAMLGHGKTKTDSRGNWIKLTGPTTIDNGVFEKGAPVTYWRDIKYYN